MNTLQGACFSDAPCAFLSGALRKKSVPVANRDPFATIAVAPPEDVTSLPKNWLSRQYDWLVLLVLGCLPSVITLNSARSSQFAAVAKDCASFTSNSLAGDVYPEIIEWEGVLALPEFAAVNDKNSNEKEAMPSLADELQHEAPSSRRFMCILENYPDTNRSIVDLLRRNSLDVIICTSIEGLENLKTQKQSHSCEKRLVQSLANAAKDRATDWFKKFQSQKRQYEFILKTLARKTYDRKRLPKRIRRTSWSNIGIYFRPAIIVMLFILRHTFYYLRG